MEWVVAFDIREEGFTEWWVLLPALVILVFNTLFFWNFGKLSTHIAKKYVSLPVLGHLYRPFMMFPSIGTFTRVIGVVFCSLFIIVMSASLYLSFVEYETREQILEDETFMPMEGYVSDFFPSNICPNQDVGREQNEGLPKKYQSFAYFSLNGEQFSYSKHEPNGGFNHTASCGGPLRNELYVRLWHVDGVIIRLEIQQGE